MAIIADALVGAAEMMKRVSKMPDYPYVVTPFPVGNLRTEEIAERARQMIPEVVRLLQRGANERKAAA